LLHYFARLKGIADRDERADAIEMLLESAALATIGKLHPMLNFPLFGVEMTGAAGWIVWHRAYTCAVAGGLIWMSIRLWQRKS
jgi:hypothetical protein